MSSWSEHDNKNGSRGTPPSASVDANTAARFEALLAQNVGLMRVLDWAPALGQASYYLAAGAVAQTVWNARAGRDPAANIADYQRRRTTNGQW